MELVELQQQVSRELTGGERLLWFGRPRQGLMLRPTDAARRNKPASDRHRNLSEAKHHEHCPALRTEISFSEAADGSGTITLGPYGSPAWRSPSSLPGSRLTFPPLLEGIPQVRSVYETIRDAQKNAA